MNDNEYAPFDDLEISRGYTLNRIFGAENNSTEIKQAFNYRLYQNEELVFENEMELFRVQNNIQVRTIITKNGLSMNLYFQRK